MLNVWASLSTHTHTHTKENTKRNTASPYLKGPSAFIWNAATSLGSFGAAVKRLRLDVGNSQPAVFPV